MTEAALAAFKYAIDTISDIPELPLVSRVKVIRRINNADLSEFLAPEEKIDLENYSIKKMASIIGTDIDT